MATAAPHSSSELVLPLPLDARAAYAQRWGVLEDELAAGQLSRVEQFFEQHLTHTKGKWMGEPFQLLPWQRKVLRDVFETRNADGTRQYRTAYISVPRKNGKTEFAAGIALYMLAGDEENGAEVYGAAHDRNQAGTLYTMARRMVQADPAMSKAIRVLRNSMVFDSPAHGQCYYQPLSSDAGGAHSTSPHCAICDEVHTWTGQRGRELYEALTSGQGSREQPLTLVITTRGNDRQGICFELDDYADKVERGVVEDPTFYSFRAFAEVDADWHDPATWVAANPSVGRTVSWRFLQERYGKTHGSPSARSAFRTFNLNTWGQATSRWIDPARWAECAATFTAEELHGRKCFGGLDLSNTTDLTAFVLAFPPVDGAEPWKLLPFFWIPQDNIAERKRRDGVPYDQWSQDGYLTATPGNIVDHGQVIAQVEQLATVFDIQAIAFDRWGSVQVSTRLQDAGLELVAFGQGFASMSPPTKSLEEKIIDGSVIHPSNPVLTWCADNVVVRQDEAENKKPDKARSAERIDGVVAAIMALGIAEADTPSTELLTSSPVSFF